VIDELLADPGWQRLLAAARRKLERTQGELTGTVGLTKPTEAERRTVIGITGRHRGAEVATLRVDLSEMDDAVWEACGLGLHAVLAKQGGPVRNRPAERASEEAARADALAEARIRCSAHAGAPWFEQWPACSPTAP